MNKPFCRNKHQKKNAGHVFSALPAIRFAAGSLGLLVSGLLTELYNLNKILLLEGGLLIITAVSGWFIAPLKKNTSALKQIIHEDLKSAMVF